MMILDNTVSGETTLYNRTGDVENFKKFELQSITFFDKKNALGHAVVFMNRNNHASKFEIIFKRDKNKKYHFYYQNHVCLDYDEHKEFEAWFKLMIPTE